MEVEGWSEYRKLILATLERLEGSIAAVAKRLEEIRHDGMTDLNRLRADEIAKLREEITALRIEFSMQKVRVSWLGAGAGALPMLVAALIWYLNK